ncbi:beta-glucosidase-related glycosidase [Rothia mucilaginosa DY-18]|uniref:Beta-glucosidase-related glycosidase n=1 Tax=Rothia mucilaginosa (strain DY-18) TaxID=680646 RepID=D2NPT8_ROTMD|nr:beta-glucosidase-related glycosidase [Rothia mucilaginosa DY-18]
MAVQHIRQTSSQLVALGTYLHDEGTVDFAQVTVAAENTIAVEGEAQTVGQFCGAELAAHVRAELLDVSGGAVGCYDGALAYRQGFRGGVVLSGVFLRGFSHGGLLLIYAEFSSMPKKAHHTEPGIRRRFVSPRI